jgi:hypothetical protein
VGKVWARFGQGLGKVCKVPGLQKKLLARRCPKRSPVALAPLGRDLHSSGRLFELVTEQSCMSRNQAPQSRTFELYGHRGCRLECWANVGAALSAPSGLWLHCESLRVMPSGLGPDSTCTKSSGHCNGTGTLTCKPRRRRSIIIIPFAAVLGFFFRLFAQRRLVIRGIGLSIATSRTQRNCQLPKPQEQSLNAGSCTAIQEAPACADPPASLGLPSNNRDLVASQVPGPEAFGTSMPCRQMPCQRLHLRHTKLNKFRADSLSDIYHLDTLGDTCGAG